MLFTAQLESSKSRNNETTVNTPCVCVPRRYVKEHIVVAILVRFYRWCNTMVQGVRSLVTNAYNLRQLFFGIIVAILK